MTAAFAKELERIPMSRALASTLARAAEYASSQAHLEITLDHLLLALTEDQDAEVVLATSKVNVAELKRDVASHLGLIEDRLPLDQKETNQISPDVRRILEASAQAAQGRRKEINGAIVLAAIVGDGNSTAANLLRVQGLTFEAAIQALQTSLATPEPNTETRTGPSTSRPLPGSATAEDFLAQARAKIQSKKTTTDRPARSHKDASILVSATRNTGSTPTFSQTAPPPQKPKPELKAGEDLTTRRPPAPPDETTQAATSPDETWAQPKSAPPPAPPPQPPSMRPPPPLQTDVPKTAPPGYQPEFTNNPTQPGGPPAGGPLSGGLSTGRPTIPGKAAAPGQFPPGPLPQGGRPPQPAPANTGIPPPVGNAPRPPWQSGAEQRHKQAEPFTPQNMGHASGTAPEQIERTQRPTRSQRAKVEAGQLVENVPRTMKVDVPTLAEVSIARADVKNLTESLSGPAPAHRHNLMITKAMSVRLRAPDGGFFIETASPETQWIDNNLGIETDDHATWRWNVTPKTRGRKRLQVIVSARTVGTDGLAAETALPDQVIEVKVKTNYAKSAKHLIGWTVAAVIGGLFARFGEQILENGQQLVTTIMSAT